MSFVLGYHSPSRNGGVGHGSPHVPVALSATKVQFHAPDPRGLNVYHPAVPNNPNATVFESSPPAIANNPIPPAVPLRERRESSPPAIASRALPVHALPNSTPPISTRALPHGGPLVAVRSPSHLRRMLDPATGNGVDRGSSATERERSQPAIANHVIPPAVPLCERRESSPPAIATRALSTRALPDGSSPVSTRALPHGIPLVATRSPPHVRSTLEPATSNGVDRGSAVAAPIRMTSGIIRNYSGPLYSPNASNPNTGISHHKSSVVVKAPAMVDQPIDRTTLEALASAEARAAQAEAQVLLLRQELAAKTCPNFQTKNVDTVKPDSVDLFDRQESTEDSLEDVPTSPTSYGIRTQADAAVLPERALQKLREGNRRYVKGRPLQRKFDLDSRKVLAEHGQLPFAAVIGCADSRCPLEILFDVQPGDLFVLRNAGNTCTHAEGSMVGSVEYGVGPLRVNLVVVLGHTKCGAIAGATNTAMAEMRVGNDGTKPKSRPTTLDRLLGGLVPVAMHAAADLPPGASVDEVASHAVKINVFHTIEKLLTYSKPLREKVSSGNVQVHGAIYDIVSGNVEFLGICPRQALVLDMDTVKVDQPLFDRHDETPCIHGIRTQADAPVSAASALQKLMDGNIRFMDEKPTQRCFNAASRKALAEHGQLPFATIIGCADSRCPVEILFDVLPGDLFVLRNAGNTCTHAEGSMLGSVEYSVGPLRVNLVLVLGHTKCGAIGGATSSVMEATGKQENAGKGDRCRNRRSTGLANLLTGLGPVAVQAAADLPDIATVDEVAAHAVKVNVFHTMEKLLTYSRLLREKVNRGELQVQGAIYDIVTGQVEFLGICPRQTLVLDMHTSLDDCTSRNTA